MNIIARTLSVAKLTKQPRNGLRRWLHSLRSQAISGTRELDVLSAYAEWAPNYPAHAHNALMRAEEQAMLGLLPDPRGKLAADLACGTGRYARILHERGATRVLAADLSPDMLAHADKRDADFVRADIARLPVNDNTFDLVVCGLAIGHVKALERALQEISRVMKRGGTCLYSDFHPLGHLAGWRREFNGSNGTRYSVEHHPHFYSDHDAACRAAGLRITAVSEPIIGRDITESFPGSDELYRRWNGWPAVLVIRAERQ